MIIYLQSRYRQVLDRFLLVAEAAARCNFIMIIYAVFYKDNIFIITTSAGAGPLPAGGGGGGPLYFTT